MPDARPQTSFSDIADAEVMPLEALRQSPLDKVKNSVRYQLQEK